MPTGMRLEEAGRMISSCEPSARICRSWPPGPWRSYLRLHVGETEWPRLPAGLKSLGLPKPKHPPRRDRMKLTPWYLIAVAPIAAAGCSGAFMGQFAVLAVTLCIFVGTLS